MRTSDSNGNGNDNDDDNNNDDYSNNDNNKDVGQVRGTRMRDENDEGQG